jgi:hypothetical protein
MAALEHGVGFGVDCCVSLLSRLLAGLPGGFIDCRLEGDSATTGESRGTCMCLERRAEIFADLGFCHLGE